MASEPIYRRVRQSERKDLERLCESNSRSSKYYRSHGEWLKKALQDISSNERVVFGAFEFKNEAFRSKLSLTACIFLKYSIFQKSMEFKNLILPHDEKVASTLIDKAIRFCEIRNIDKIEIEVPQEEHGTISLFLQKKFKIVSIREQYKTPSILVCVLERSESDKYFGDPFDTTKLALWLLKQYIACEKIEVKEIDDFDHINFVVKTAIDFPFPTNKRLHGTVWIIEDEIDVNFDFLTGQRKKNPHLNLVVTRLQLEDEVSTKLQQKNIVLFEKDDLEIISGGPDSSLSIPFSKNNVGGFVTVLGYAEIEEYLRRGNTLTYYLFGISISSLIKGIDPEEQEVQEEDEEYYLVIYCPDYKEGIFGFYTFSKFTSARFESLLTKYEIEGLPKDSALTKDDLEFYSTFSKNEYVTAIEGKDFYAFDPPLGLKEPGGWESSPKVADYIYNHVNSGNNSFYLDIESCKKLNLLKGQQTKNNKDMLESFLAALAALANYSTIATAIQQQIDRTEKELKDAQNSGQDIIIESETSPALLNLAEGYSNRLNLLTNEFRKISEDPSYNSLEKDIQIRKIALQALKILNTFKNTPHLILSYKDLYDIFSEVSE